MLKRRLIARLDIQEDRLIKTVRMEGRRYVGDPEEFVAHYDAAGIDEIIYMDVVASLYGRNHLADLVRRTTANVFCPITVGGGVRSVEDAADLLRAGADKIAINSAAIRRPRLITEMAEKFGSQCMVIQIDAKRNGDGWEAWIDGGREPSILEAVEWAESAVGFGAGEILLTSIDNEGTQLGFDCKLTRRVAQRTGVPVVASGGMGTATHAVEAIQAGADAVAMAHVLHYGTIPLQETRKALTAAKIPVRMEA